MEKFRPKDLFIGWITYRLSSALEGNGHWAMPLNATSRDIVGNQIYFRSDLWPNNRFVIVEYEEKYDGFFCVKKLRFAVGDGKEFSPIISQGYGGKFNPSELSILSPDVNYEEADPPMTEALLEIAQWFQPNGV